jgi:glycosyltransferase involved in cell wall biosynthesis
MAAVHQFIPTYAPRDAIGTHARHARRILRGMGLESEIYAEGVARGAGGDALPYRKFAGGPAGRTWLLYQMSTGSKLGDYLISRPEPLVVNYHNVTPWRLFAPWEPLVGAELRFGREQLNRLAGRAELGVAVSGYNEAELKEAGFARTAMSPVLVDLEGMRSDVDRAALDRLMAAKARGGADWLFVGRVAPHKGQHHVVKAFAAYRRLYDPLARLHIVGAPGSHSYWTVLHRYASALGVGKYVSFTGSVPGGVLEAHYQAADAFVCLSDHEGFCVPLVEAMRNRVPVVAAATSAIPETVAGAGVLLHERSPMTVAAAVDRVLTDGDLRSTLVAAGEERAADFTLARSEARFVEVVSDLQDMTARFAQSCPGDRR